MNLRKVKNKYLGLSLRRSSVRSYLTPQGVYFGRQYVHFLYQYGQRILLVPIEILLFIIALKCTYLLLVIAGYITANFLSHLFICEETL